MIYFLHSSIAVSNLPLLYIPFMVFQFFRFSDTRESLFITHTHILRLQDPLPHL